MKHLCRIALVFFMLFLSAYTVSGQTASFTEDYVSGCSPLVVHFTNTSTGATSYSWNLGNGVITGSTDPSTSYITPGTYVVTLTAYNGSSSSVSTVTITVYPTPTVSFYASQTAVCPGVPVTFFSTSSSGVAGPLTYIWNFGDGTSSTAISPSHAYTSSGYYNITLSATNSQGCVSSVTEVAYIQVYTLAAISFNASTTYICNPPEAITFTNTSTGMGPFTSSWNFGDGGTGTGSPATHTYSIPGTYNVTLTETDGHGCSESVVYPAFIFVGTITAAFTGPATACINTPVTFTNTSSGSSINNWNFGDGSTSTAVNGTHSYTSAGTYTVTLIVSNGFCYDTVVHTITILPGAIASFTISPTFACPPPTTATFTSTVPPGSTVVWKFGDGSSGSGTTTTHTYASCGIDTVSMIVTNASGCIDTVKQIYKLYNMVATINNGVVPSGCVPLTVPFSCSVMSTCPVDTPYPYPITSYTWNFGDGSASVSGGAGTSHTYTAVGTYTCTVTFLTSNGCPDTAHLKVLVGTPPVISFSATPTTVCYGHSVSFINTTTGATGYLWFFGDGGSDTLTDPLYNYGYPDTFTVTLIANDNGCADTLTKALYITVDSPMAIISANYFCNPPNEVIFGDSSLGDNSHLWIFGDGTTSTADDTVHFYPALTTYTVTLATYNTASGCRDTATEIIDLVKPTITFHASDTAICLSGIVNFTSSVTGGAASGYYWYQNGIYVDGYPSFSDTFNVSGLYTITLVIRDDHNCPDTLTKNHYILVAKPHDIFTEIPSPGCAPLLVDFTDVSTDVAGTFFTNYNWTFGDGLSASVATNPTGHTYTAAGTYSVTEVVTDNIGCKDTATGTVTAYKPAASFYASPTYPCIGSVVSFSNTSAGIVSSYWMFGDGGTSTATSPTHIYNAAGAYTVSLIVTDVHGCTDTLTYVNYINVTKPVAAFSQSDSFSICPPLSDTFINLSSGGATSYNWTFGDGNASTDVNATDLYITSGYYTVMLIATNAYGCKDTATEIVNLYGYSGAFTCTPDSGCAPLTVHFASTLANVPFILWDFGDGSTSSNSSSPDTVHTYTLPGGYAPKLILSDNTGCQNSSSGPVVKVDAVYPAFITGPACIGDTTDFFDSSSSYWSTITSYAWSFGGGVTSTIANPTYLYGAVGTYTVSLRVTDAWGCTAVDTQAVIIHPLPVITTTADTTICVGDTATLTAFGAVSYVWAPPATLACTACNPAYAGPVVPSTYTVMGTDIYGCVGTDTVSVFMRTTTTSGSYGDTAVCQGTSVPLFDTGATYYTWIPPSWLSSSSSSNPTATPQATTTYTVIAQLGRCIPDTNYITVTVYPLPTVYAGPDQTLVAGSVAQLQATGTNIYTYSWSPPGTLSCLDCSNPVATMSVNTTYFVGVSSIHGCLSSDSVTIHLYCSSGQLFIPNTFTPNNDGENDVFYPRGTGVELIKSFRIYNRWGELLFEKENIQINDATNAWDGTYNGMAPRPDVYVYVIDALCETGEPLFIKGSVTVVR